MGVRIRTASGANAVGVSCNDDMGARATAKFIATKVSIGKPQDHQRYDAILNECGDEIDQAFISAHKLRHKKQRLRR